MIDVTQLPSFTAMCLYRDVANNCSFFYAEGWQAFPLDDPAGGTVLLPDLDDPETSLSFQARDVGTEVRAADLATLRAGFMRGLRGLPGCKIESRETESVGALITMEARLTFRDGEAIRKRWVRLAYQGRTQARLIAQGSTPDRFAYWEPMFFQAMRTFQFADWAGQIMDVEGTPEREP